MTEIVPAFRTGYTHFNSGMALKIVGIPCIETPADVRPFVENPVENAAKTVAENGASVIAAAGGVEWLDRINR